MSMITPQDKKAFTDLSIIFTMMPTQMRNKINNKFIAFIEGNKDTSHSSTINPTVPLRNQKLSAETEVLLALIYRDYLCDEKTQLELKKQEKLSIEEKYSITYQTKQPEQSMPENTSLITTESDNVFSRFLKKLKNLFMKH